MTSNIWTIAQLEFVGAARLRWVRLLTAAFVLLAGAAAYSAGAADELSGADGFARTTMALVPVVLILVPIAALVLGVSGQSAEEGGEPFLFSQPVARTTVLLGRWIGEAAALGGAIVAGFGAGGGVVAFGSGTNGLPQFAFFILAAVALAIVFLSIAAAIAAFTDRRVTALGIGTFAWFFFVLLYDGLALSLAGSLTGSFGGRVLFASIFGNPADVVRVAMLLVSGTSNVLGAAGEAWIRFLGGATAALATTLGALVVWTVAPLAVAGLALSRRDL